ncbi:heavy metal sensor histidine kinase [Pseudomonas oryzihabitans]|uniref:Sensor protein n=3 Tax=Pseudomonas TaxID=286 RepID=A0A178L6E0_9PSED|nr:heavy metal sensor histidine kinase [Pseudomonas psychrotolerans]NMZ66870.1 heavy metal sensor histidine kinase [Pseudomonas oryzihabitans]NRH44939.1 heavy metal sensor histidine kinase [Pseudomonas sp. MS15a(2019)]OYT76193.1 MAG: two-component sensor histidine kinase [Pseudomonas sp. PGPPP2]TCQ83011.1 two-component system heavy metal sensor histidine kinase CusS [Pseudomonas sp. JUb52]HAC68641.1 HAMP domain-containing protein [Pseudomonas sp.]
MRPMSLALRLGLMVTGVGLLLAILLVVMVYSVLDRELGRRAADQLQAKLGQIQHSLEERPTDPKAPWQHSLADTLLGHEELSVTVLSATGDTPLYGLGSHAYADELRPERWPDAQTLAWHSDDGHDLLTARANLTIPGLPPLQLLLSQDRSNDSFLLDAFLRAALISLPILLLLIGAAAWWTGYQGLAPLRRFRRTARSITTRQLTLRVDDTNLPAEVAELATALNTMLERLNAGVQLLDRFADDVAHELRTPLGILIGRTQMILSRKRDETAYQQALEESLDELDRLSRIVTDMLLLARLDSHEPLSSLGKVAVEHEALRVCSLFEAYAEARELELAVEGQLLVEGDTLMIQRAISNVLSNAIRHAYPGTEVTVTLFRREDGVGCVAVTNQGPPIATEELPRLFERFYRGSDRHTAGNGLGLAIVRAIMAYHGGGACVECSEGQTRFLLKFPPSSYLLPPLAVNGSNGAQ